MSVAPVTTDSAAILGEAWPDNSVEIASEQLAQVQQLAGVMTREAEARATVASSIRAVAESEGFDVGHSVRDARVAAYSGQAEIAQGALTQAWWAILGYSKALEGTLTAIVYAYQPRLDAARVLAATEPAAGAAAYTEALAEAIAEREAALAAATSGITAQVSVLSGLATQAAGSPSASGGSTLGLFRGAAGGQESAPAGLGAAAGAAAGATLAALRSEANTSASGAVNGAAASGETLSEFRGVASQGGATSGAALDAKGSGGAVLDTVRGEAASQGPVAGSGSQIVSGGSQSASSAAGRAGGAGTEIAGQAGSAGADAAGQAGTSADAAASVTVDSSGVEGNMSVARDAGADASSAGAGSGSSSVSPQASMSGDVTAGSVSPAATAGLAASAGAQISAPAPSPSPLAGNPAPAAMPPIAPVTAGSALAAGSAQAAGPTVAPPTGPAVRTPSVTVSPYSPGASSFAVPSAAAAGPGAAAAASGVAAGAIGGAAAGAGNPGASESVMSADLRRALATVAALADAGAGRVGWAVAVLARRDGAREYLFASTLAGGYVPRGVYPYAELAPAFPPPMAPADVLGLADPAVALVEHQKRVFPDWQLSALASSQPVAGIRDLIDPAVTQSKQVSSEDLVLSPMTELGPRTVHRLDLVHPGGFQSAMTVPYPAREFFAAAWQAHEANASGPGARSRAAVLDDLMASREPMPATWDDLQSDHAAHSAALFGWGAVTEANAAHYLAAFTDLMASETLLAGRGGNVTPDDLADALYTARLAVRRQAKVIVS